MAPTLRDARPSAAEAALLSALALRSKGHWGYDAAFLESCRDELTLSADELASRRTRVAVVDGEVAGFSTLEGEPPHGEIGMLFVDPVHIGRGLGGLLVRDLLARAGEEGFTRLHIDADPSAEAFYLAHGAVRVGEVASGSIPGRVLPQLEMSVGGGTLGP